MKLYLECQMGASGDMIMAALLELLPDRDLFFKRMRNLGLPGVQISCGYATKCGITGTKMHITVNGVAETSNDVDFSDAQHHHGHDHRHTPSHGHGSGAETSAHQHAHAHVGYDEICSLIQNLDLAENVKDAALHIYKLIGEAEAAVHGILLSQVIFSEVGSLDAVADIVGCCLLFQMIGANRIESSPIHVGSGFVRCAHGLLPVPAPATAHILKGVPIYGGNIKGELCTPTGAAILRHFVKRFGDMEPMAVSKIGYGMGTKDFKAANCLRAYLSDHSAATDTVTEIICNLDDMTPEAVGFATALLMREGALDVFVTPIYMKKNRPASMLSCLCKPEDTHHLSQLILRNTTTFGIRYQTYKRDILEYTTYKVKTPYGEIRIKRAHGHGLTKQKPEYEDVQSAALLHGVSFSEVFAAASTAMDPI